jgi:protein-S-isoprenylcysteine O-methyltransferase Ste14
MKTLELKIPPLLLFALCAAGMYGLAMAAPALSFTTTGTGLAAGVVAAAGAGVAIAGVAAFRRNRTTVDPRTPDKSASLVSGGVYRLSRNPMYLGFLLLLAGWTLFLSNLAPAFVLPVFVAYMNRFQIEPEERILAAKFGAPFADYLTTVRRWI